MPKSSAAATLAARLLEELMSVRAAGGDQYPAPLARLTARLEPAPDDSAVQKAIAGKAFTGRAIVAVKGRPDAPVALAEDADFLAGSPLTLAAALAAKAVKAPPWPPKQLASTLNPALRPRFLQVLDEQIAGGRLPPFVGVVTKGQTARLYHRDNPPPPPPQPKEQVLAGRLVEALRGRRAAGPGHYPTTVRQLAASAGTSVDDAVLKKALKESAFADHVALASWKHPADSPVALTEDLTALAGSELLLTSLLAACDRVDAHAFPAKDLISKLDDPKPKRKNPLKAATQARLEADGLDRHLPPGIGYVEVGNRGRGLLTAQL